MKRTLLGAVLACGMIQNAGAQTIVIDTVVTGPNYQNNIWYSLANDANKSAQATAQAANNWHIAIATSLNPSNSLTTSVLFNYKMGEVYEAVGSNPANFATFTLTPNELAALTPLYNSDITWTEGAFKNTTTLPGADYGWGGYDQTSHSVLANRIFVIKNTANSTYYKMTIDMVTMQGQYVVKYAELNSSTPTTKEITMSQYSTKNFVYLSLTDGSVIDREPATAAWDLTFLQYPTDLGAMGTYPVAGVLHNHGVEVAKVHPVNTTTLVDWNSQTFSPSIKTIGYNWKNAGQSGVTIEDSTVFFVKAKTGDIWKVIMTGFISGSGGGNSSYIFSKQRISTASVDELESNIFMNVYPNPANESVTLVLDNKSASSVNVYNTLGALVYSTEVTGNGLQTVQVPVVDFNTGIYHVVCTSNGATATQKLMVQH